MAKGLDAFLSAKKDIPDIRVTLPYSGKEILMKPFNTKQQMAVLKALQKEDFKLVHAALDALLEACVVNEDFNLDDLIAKERDILLVNLRMESVDENYIYPWTCNSCKKYHEDNVDLRELKLEEPKGEMISDIVLDHDIEGGPATITVGITTRKQEKDFAERLEDLENEEDDVISKEVALLMYASAISKLKIGDVEYTGDDFSFDDRVRFVHELSLDDVKKIENFANQVGGLQYDFKREHTCTNPDCKHTQVDELDWISFFMV